LPERRAEAANSTGNERKKKRKELVLLSKRGQNWEKKKTVFHLRAVVVRQDDGVGSSI